MFHVKIDVNLIAENSIQSKNSTKISVNAAVKKLIKHHVCKENYAWKPSTCACECDKHCEIDKYLKNCTCVKSIIDDLLVTCDKTEDTPETVSINSDKKKQNIK